MKNFKDFTKVATLYETTSGNVYDAQKHRIEDVNKYCKENKISELVIFSQEQNYAGFRSFYTNQVEDKKHNLSAIRLDYYHDDYLWRLGEYTNLKTQDNKLRENRTTLMNYDCEPMRRYWGTYYSKERQMKHLFINDDLTVTFVYSIMIGEREFSYVVNQKCTFNGRSINDTRLEYFDSIKDLTAKGLLNNDEVENLAQESDVFDLIKEIHGDNNEKWLIEITDQNIDDLTLMKEQGKVIESAWDKSSIRNGNSSINDLEVCKRVDDDITVYWLGDTNHQTTWSERYFADSTIDKFVETFSKCEPVAQIYASLIDMKRREGTCNVFMKDIIDLMQKARTMYKKSLSEAKKMNNKKKQTVMTPEEMFSTLQFPENCTGFIAQRVGDVIYITGNTTATDGWRSSWRLRGGLWVITYDTVHRKKAIYERYSYYNGEIHYEKKALLEHLAIEMLTPQQRYYYGRDHHEPDRSQIGWRFIPSFNEVFKDTLIDYLSNAPSYIMAERSWNERVSVKISCTEQGWNAYSIKLLMTGVKPMFEMLAKSQLYHMYALYSRERAAGSNFSQSKTPNDNYGAWGDAYYANLHKGKDLATMFGLTIKQLRVYDAYLEKAMYDQNHNEINNPAIMGLAHIEDFLNPLSIEEMRAILIKIDPTYEDASNIEIIEAAFKHNIHANAVKTVDVATLGKMFDEIAKVNKCCGRLCKWNISPTGKEYDINSTESLKAYIRPMKLMKRAEFLTQLMEGGDNTRSTIRDYWNMRGQILALADRVPDKVLGGYINSLRQADPQNLKGLFDEEGHPLDVAYIAAKNILIKQYPLWPSKKTVYVRYNPEDVRRNTDYGSSYMRHMIQDGCVHINNIPKDAINNIMKCVGNDTIRFNNDAEAFGNAIYTEDIFLSQTINKMFVGSKNAKYNVINKYNSSWHYYNGEGSPTDRAILDSEDIELDYATEAVQAHNCQVYANGEWYDIRASYYPLNGVLMHLNQFEAMKYLHDTLSAIISLYQNEAKEAAFAGTVKRVEDLEYSDEESGLSIVVPCKASDVVYEGHTLGHCVASYVDSIIDGKCNILFIRHTDMIDKPYFTMEITPNGDIRQVHSFHNGQVTIESQQQAYANSGYEVYKEPKDIVAFLTKWAKACNKAKIAPSLKSIKNNYGALCHL